MIILRILNLIYVSRVENNVHNHTSNISLKFHGKKFDKRTKKNSRITELFQDANHGLSVQVSDDPTQFLKTTSIR